MIEKTALDYLSSILDVQCYMEVPEKMPARFVTIEKTGSGVDNLICSATLAIQSWGVSLYDAAMLNEKVKTAMANFIDLDRISKSKLNSDYNFTDISTKRYRYQAVFDVYYYEEA